MFDKKKRVYKICFINSAKKGVGTVRSDYVYKEELEHLLATLMPENRLACEISLATGLRIGDVLALKSRELKPRMTVREEKTGKVRHIYMPKDLLERCHQIKGHIYVFEHRTDGRKHRTRQAVYKDIKRSAKMFRVTNCLQVSPHTMRKVYAVEHFQEDGDLEKLQRMMNHSKSDITYLYAMADVLTKRKLQKNKVSKAKIEKAIRSK